MNTLKSWRFWVLNLVMVTVAFMNLFVLSHSQPFMGHNKTFNVNRVIQHSTWVEGAPVVLTNHFSQVDVSHIGDRFKNGFGFESELVGIFKVHSVDRKQDPIDLRGKITLKDLQRYDHYQTTTHCSVYTSKYCSLHLLWDSGNSAPYRSFIGARLDDTFIGGKTVAVFALIDENVFRNLIGDPNAN